MTKEQKTVVALKPSSHSCFWYETGEIVVSVYSKQKERLTLGEINAAIDIAKSQVVDRMRRK